MTAHKRRVGFADINFAKRPSALLATLRALVGQIPLAEATPSAAILALTSILFILLVVTNVIYTKQLQQVQQNVVRDQAQAAIVSNQNALLGHKITYLLAIYHARQANGLDARNFAQWFRRFPRGAYVATVTLKHRQMNVRGGATSLASAIAVYASLRQDATLDITRQGKTRQYVITPSTQTAKGPLGQTLPPATVPTTPP
ncbi:MAG: hypothetical protein ACYDHD_02630 [Vulcanimicrobiaceae bacterium]